MSKIKRYIEFISENSRELVSEHVSNIKDILSPIEDLDINVSVVSDFLIRDSSNVINVIISSKDNKGFKWSDIEDDFLRLMDYSSDYYKPSNFYYKEVQEDGRIFNKHDMEEMKLSNLNEYFTKSRKKIWKLSIILYGKK
jgi:hypothetical protein